MIALTGADLVLPDRLLQSATLTIHDGRIVDISAGAPAGQPSAVAFPGHTIAPGFIDVHVHGVSGVDTHDEDDAVGRIASALPRFGVTAFCPTTVACAPADLQRVLDQVRRWRGAPSAYSARVLPAHLESNFLNPEYCGAQPRDCLRRAAALLPANRAAGSPHPGTDAFTAQDILRVIETGAADIAIVTMAPEIEGGLELVAWLVGLGIRVSLGHSGATCDEGLAAIAAGARQATHLFNRMPPLHHRQPGLAGAVLQSNDVAAEVICDGTHVHPALVRLVVAAKTPSRVMAVSDGTAASALPPGTSARLGGRTIVASATCATLEDGTMAGSTLTMDEAFRRLTGLMGFSPVDAVVMCATTPARELGLVGHGLLAEGAVADLVVLDRAGAVVQTYVGGRLVYARGAT
ncbi:MAG TPA: N-acetylglucosamine-6-phosphate deacetylase [Vicinamibacterales bacterium]|nr:N-acetylglucosamine-6-phosphate deacetylase [Vicinamibacterales bacterium]